MVWIALIYLIDNFIISIIKLQWCHHRIIGDNVGHVEIKVSKSHVVLKCILPSCFKIEDHHGHKYIQFHEVRSLCRTYKNNRSMKGS